MSGLRFVVTNGTEARHSPAMASGLQSRPGGFLLDKLTPEQYAKLRRLRAKGPLRSCSQVTTRLPTSECAIRWPVIVPV
jgi:hypothetical protein